MARSWIMKLHKAMNIDETYKFSEIMVIFIISIFKQWTGKGFALNNCMRFACFAFSYEFKMIWMEFY